MKEIINEWKKYLVKEASFVDLSNYTPTLPSPIDAFSGKIKPGVNYDSVSYWVDPGDGSLETLKNKVLRNQAFYDEDGNLLPFKQMGSCRGGEGSGNCMFQISKPCKPEDYEDRNSKCYGKTPTKSLRVQEAPPVGDVPPGSTPPPSVPEKDTQPKTPRLFRKGYNFYIIKEPKAKGVGMSDSTGEYLFITKSKRNLPVPPRSRVQKLFEEYVSKDFAIMSLMTDNNRPGKYWGIYFGADGCGARESVSIWNKKCGEKKLKSFKQWNTNKCGYPDGYRYNSGLIHRSFKIQNFRGFVVDEPPPIDTKDENHFLGNSCGERAHDSDVKVGTGVNDYLQRGYGEDIEYTKEQRETDLNRWVNYLGYKPEDFKGHEVGFKRKGYRQAFRRAVDNLINAMDFKPQAPAPSTSGPTATGATVIKPGAGMTGPEGTTERVPNYSGEDMLPENLWRGYLRSSSCRNKPNK